MLCKKDKVKQKYMHTLKQLYLQSQQTTQDTYVYVSNLCYKMWSYNVNLTIDSDSDSEEED